ncbi:MAG: cupin domain-containing protein [Ktedonobacteraceae bacterium]|nr:cupin domain-containing protein [Ktedonobacteraceae bacterium]
MNQPSQIPENHNDQIKEEQPAEPGSVIQFDLRKLTHFRDDGPAVQVLSDVGTARLVLFAFKAGQQLKEHRTSSQLLVQVLRGRVTFTTPGSSVDLRAGMVLQVEANVPHSVTAPINAVMLLTMTPSPTYHSLEHEVFEKLTPLVSRKE